MSSCLGSDTLLAWVEGTLPAAARTAAIAHIAGCARCREATSALARAAPTRDGSHGGGDSSRDSGDVGGDGDPRGSDGDTIRSSPPAAAEVADRAWLPGTSLGRYQIEGFIAQGGMGMVLIAVDPTLQRKVAIKVSRPAGAVRAAALEARLIQEARALARLRHPNIVAIYDAGRDGDDLFLVQELIEGESMRAWLDRRHPWKDAIGVCISAGRGLEALHQAGLAHRDIKPENILLATDGRIVLVDLGLVARTGGPESSPLTARGAVVGTPRYMAPEQLAGSRGDARSDQYAFALVVREALLSATPPPPPALRAALARAMDPAPAFRYSSMTELLAALTRAAKPRPWRRPAVLATGGASALGLAALLYGAVRSADSPPVSPPPSSAVALPPSSAVAPPPPSSAGSPPPSSAGSPPPSSAVAPPPSSTTSPSSAPAPAVPSPAVSPSSPSSSPPSSSPPRSSPKPTPSPPPPSPSPAPPAPVSSPSPELIAEAERRLGLHVRPADYDPAHFDASKYLVVARDLARSVVDDVELTSINLEPMMPDGTIDLRMSANYGYYEFRSPNRSKLPEGTAPNVSMRRKCVVMVFVEPTRITAQEINTTECHQLIGPPPRCTFKQLRARVLQLGAPADLAGKVTWSVKHGWDFSTDLGQPLRNGERRFQVSLLDNC